MNETEQDILDTMNQVIREEKGMRVTINSSLKDANLDSFGYTVLFLELDDKYNIFIDVPVGEDPYATIDWDTITVREVIERCM